MKQVLQIPADVGGYGREAADALTAHARLIERALLEMLHDHSRDAEADHVGA